MKEICKILQFQYFLLKILLQQNLISFSLKVFKPHLKMLK